MIIAIDGPSGAGKSTVAKAVAKKLGFSCLDTGAMYRAVAWRALQDGVPFDDDAALGRLARTHDIAFGHEPGDPAPKSVSIGGEDVTRAIRTAEIDRAVSPVSAAPSVREALVGQQRRIGRAGDYVVEGRDIGTVVFPEAEVKVFLTASDEERAHRRVRQNADRSIGSIDFDDVSFKYSKKAERMALADVDLHIRSGEVIGILGGTGSSKSTLVQLIPRLYDVTEGSVRVGGRDVREYDIEALRSNVAVVLQKNQLFSGTIKENLRWGNPNATDEELVHACRLACADEFIRSFPDGYDTHIEQGGTNVSGGQKQRLCIARALLKKPKILILDDSTSAVDTRTDAMIRQAFREEIPGTTKLIIAQRIASVQDADIIVVLDNGMVKDVGTHESLLASSKIYQEVYYSQQKGGEE